MREKLIALMQSERIELISSHAKLCFPIIERMYRKMSIGLKFNPIKVDKDLIIDGHHRYLASLLAGYELERIACPRSLAKTPREWKSVELVYEDWDSAGKIKWLNEQDARYNGLTTEEFVEKISYL